MNYLYAHAGQNLADRKVASTPGALLFRPTNSFTAEQEATFIDRISQYSEVVRAQGVQYLFLPIPNRETIAAPPENYEARSAFFNRLVAGVERRGVSTLNILPTYRALYLAKDYPFQTDDTHWNFRGVQVAVDRTISAVTKTATP